jgi:hypothetical protein
MYIITENSQLSVWNYYIFRFVLFSRMQSKWGGCSSHWNCHQGKADELRKKKGGVSYLLLAGTTWEVSDR